MISTNIERLYTNQDDDNTTIFFKKTVLTSQNIDGLQNTRIHSNALKCKVNWAKATHKQSSPALVDDP